MGTPGSASRTHLQLQGAVVHHEDLGEDAGAQRSAVILVKRLVHVLVQQRGLAHAGDEERGTGEALPCSGGSVTAGAARPAHTGGFPPSPAPYPRAPMMMIFRSTFLLASMDRPCGARGTHRAVGMALAPAGAGGAAQALSLLSPSQPGTADVAVSSPCQHHARAVPALAALVPQAWWGQKPPCQALPTAPPARAGLPRSRSTPRLAGSSPFKAAGSHFPASPTPSPAQSLLLSLAHAPGVPLKITFIQEDPSRVEFLGASSTAQGASPPGGTPESPRRMYPHYVPVSPHALSLVRTPETPSPGGTSILQQPQQLHPHGSVRPRRPRHRWKRWQPHPCIFP